MIIAACRRSCIRLRPQSKTLGPQKSAIGSDALDPSSRFRYLPLNLSLRSARSEPQILLATFPAIDRTNMVGRASPQRQFPCGQQPRTAKRLQLLSWPGLPCRFDQAMGRAASRNHISDHVDFFGPRMAHGSGENSVFSSDPTRISFPCNSIIITPA